LENERNRNENLSRENGELSTKLQRFESLSIKHVELVRKAEEFSAQNAELADQVEQFSNQNVQMRREIEKLDSVVADYAAQVSSLKIALDEKKTELENVRKASTGEVSELRRALALKDSEVFELNSQLRRRQSDDMVAKSPREDEVGGRVPQVLAKLVHRHARQVDRVALLSVVDEDVDLARLLHGGLEARVQRRLFQLVQLDALVLLAHRGWQRGRYLLCRR